MNILLSCAGRRNYLVEFFQEALQGHGLVLAVDASEDAPALQQADRSFILPSITHKDYIDLLLELCEQQQVRLVIPLNDLELPLLSKHRDRFLKIGTLPVVSAPEVINLCFDKWATFEFLTAHHIQAPKTYLSLADAQEALSRGEIAFPVIVKPRWGSASIGIESPEDSEELTLAYQFVKKRIARSILAGVSAVDFEHCVIIQERLPGQEYGLDVINNLDGKYVTTFCKMKLAMRAGETDRALTVENLELNNLGSILGKKLGHIGNLDCDVIVGEQGYYLLEMNPRFGGGYPFSHMAGANVIAALIAWAEGKPIDPDWMQVKSEIKAAKYDTLVVSQKAV